MCRWHPALLLPRSLTKWMPVPAAVALSSVAFGMVHLTPRDFPQVWWAGGCRGLAGGQCLQF